MPDTRVEKLATHEHGAGWMPEDAPWRDETARLILRLEAAGLVVFDPDKLTEQWVESLIDPFIKPAPRLSDEEFEHAAYNSGLEAGANAVAAALRGNDRG